MSDHIEKIYDNKNKSYYAHARADIISSIPGYGLKVLDVGCGTGTTLMELKKSGKAAEAVGIEINESAIAATRHLLDDVIIGNIENIELNYPDGYFDVIIMADVLEHMIDPWSALRKIKRHLVMNGIFIASIPNIREFNTMCSLVLKGDFKYTDAGILDRTHLRFFCRKNMMEMFENVFEIIEIKSIPDLVKGEIALLNKLTLRKFEELFVIQYIIVARNTVLPV